MKNSKDYSKKVLSLFRSLKAKYPKVKKISYDEPADALIYAIVAENMSGPDTESAIKKFDGYFIDLNDLRETSRFSFGLRASDVGASSRSSLLRLWRRDCACLVFWHIRR